MAARSKAFEANEMGWQGGGYVSLTLDRRHGVFLSANQKRGTVHAREVAHQVKRVVFPARSREPLKYFCIPYGSTNDVWIAWCAGIERKCDAQPGVEGCLVGVSLKHPTARHGADLRASQFIEHGDTSLFMRATRCFCADEDQLGGMPWVARRVSDRDFAAKVTWENGFLRPD